MRGVAHILPGLATVFLTTPALAVPTPFGQNDDGWRFATCNMEMICQSDGRCADMPVPGQTLLLRDEDGVRIGTSLRAATEVPVFPSLEAAETALALGRIAETGSVIVIAPEDTGPGWLRFVLFRATGGTMDDRNFHLSCETSPEMPDLPPETEPAPTPEGDET